MKPRFHASFRNSKNCRRVLETQILDIPQDYDLPIHRAERIDSILQSLAKLSLFEQLGRDGSPIRKILRPILAFLVFLLAVNRLVKMLTLLSQLHPGFVVGDLHEPSAKPRFSAEA